MTIRRTLWMLAALIALAGYGLVVQPAERRVEELQLHARTLYDEANTNEEKIHRSAQLTTVRSRVEADLIRLSGKSSNGATTAAALRLLSTEAKEFGVEMRSMTPDGNSTLPATRSSSNEPLRGDDWNLGMRGAFRNVLAMLSDLPRHDVLIGVRDVDLTAVSGQIDEDE